MSRRQGMPPHALVVSEYDEFRCLVRAFAMGAHDLMTIIGTGGMGKSETVVRTMQDAHGAGKWGLIKGKHSPLHLYQKLYQFRFDSLVLDDLDGLFRSADNTAILKCVCETKPLKRVEWGSAHVAFNRSDSPLPQSFDSISRVCIIANEWKMLDQNIAALHDRGVLIFFRPTALEVHKEVGRAGWFDDEEVFRYVGDHLHLMTHPSFRFYITARNHKRSGLDWRALVLRTLASAADPGLMLVAKLLADRQYDQLPLRGEQHKGERAYKEQCGESRATYHRHKKTLLERRGSFHLDESRAIRLATFKPDLHSIAMLDRRRQIEELREMAVPNKNNQDQALAADPTIPPQKLEEKPVDGLAQLQKRLERAIGREDYELAARLRDEIRRLGEG